MSVKLDIKIIGDRKQTLCQAECGSGWSRPDVQLQMKRTLWEKFGDQVLIGYYDIEDSQLQMKEPDRFPLLIVNDQLRLSGPFDMRQLIDIIETQLELGI